MPESSPRPGALVVCPTPIGNLSDVTLRLLDELRTADVVACEDTRRTRILLERHGISVPVLAVHEHNEAARAGELVERIRSGERVALATDAGMPAVSDPGARVVAAVAAAGLPVTVLPGPSAVTAAVAASGLGGGGFAFAGFLPRPAAKAAAAVRRLDACGLPIVAFESPQRLPATLATLAEPQPGRRAVVCRELSKLHEQVERGTLADLAQAFSSPPKGEVTLVLAAADTPADAADIPADALAELVAAVGARRAAAIASRLTGVPRNQLYRAATAKRP
ncbi:MAG TPA: 16S rRNA (cytidine(1402)-2'-O)-methyltransferase [Gaiellales bacterium]|nr:16S rRNA (cytidine(1402)-2'-O)-methyltransferase [Gaiellales bacterium]